MALAITNRGTTGSTVADAIINIFPTGNFAAGSMGIIALTYDNARSGGSSDPLSTITDALGNDWTRRQTNVVDPGAANAGTFTSIWTTYQNVGTLETSTKITITWTTANPAAKVITLTEISSDIGGSPTYLTGAVSGITSTTTAPTITSSSITSGDVIFGACGIEHGSITMTADSDVSSGSWSSAQNLGKGTTTAGQQITTQAKVTTGTATQTYNIGLSALADCNIMWISVDEVAPTPSVTPSITPSLTPTVTPTLTPTVTPSVTPTITPTLSPEAPSETPTVTPTVTPTSTPSVTPSVTPSETVSITQTPTLTPSVTSSITPSVTPSLTPTVTPTLTVSITQTPSVTPSLTPTLTVSITQTPSVTPTLTVSNTQTPSVTPTLTVSNTQTPSVTPSPTPSETPTPSSTPSITPSITPTISPSLTPTISPSLTPSRSVLIRHPRYYSIFLD